MKIEVLSSLFMSWLKFLFGLKIFKPICFLFSFVSDYDNESETKENKNYTGLKFLNQRKICK